MAAIRFACKCGKELQSDLSQAGRRMQCPDCGRAFVVPSPVVEKTEPTWKVDSSADVPAQAVKLSLIEEGRGSVIRLVSSRPLVHDLSIEGVFKCWHCRNPIPFTGEVFGRAGLGGTFLTFICLECKAKVWIGFSSRTTGKGANVYLYSPIRSRGQVPIEAQTSAFRIQRLKEQTPPPFADSGFAALNTLVLELTQSVNLKEPFQKVTGLAGNLVAQTMTSEQWEGVCLAVRSLVEKDAPLYLRVILVKALACLRDEGAARTVRMALHNALATEEVADPSNMPLQDLCVLALLFGDGNGFMEAMRRGMDELNASTRPSKRANSSSSARSSRSSRRAATLTPAKATWAAPTGSRCTLWYPCGWTSTGFKRKYSPRVGNRACKSSSPPGEKRRKPEDRGQRIEVRSQRTEVRSQRAEDREQKTEDGGQRTEDRSMNLKWQCTIWQ